jgi:hypothetical protein
MFYVEVCECDDGCINRAVFPGKVGVDYVPWCPIPSPLAPAELSEMLLGLSGNGRPSSPELAQRGDLRFTRFFVRKNIFCGPDSVI